MDHVLGDDGIGGYHDLLMTCSRLAFFLSFASLDGPETWEVVTHKYRYTGDALRSRIQEGWFGVFQCGPILVDSLPLFFLLIKKLMEASRGSGLGQ